MAPLRPLLFILVLTTSTIVSSSSNPFTPKSAFLRYYARKVPGSRRRPLPSFLLSRLSPLSAASFSSLLSSPSSSLPSSCASAGILCSLPLPLPLLPTAANSSGFSSYATPNFTNYGTSRSGGADSFRAYSPDLNLPVDSFRRYSASSSSRDDAFASYASDGNVVTATFASYASSAASGSGSFSSYARNANVPDLRFTSYDARAAARPRDFSSYSDDTNAGSQSFSGYGRGSERSPDTFTSYASNANVVATGFKGYGVGATSANGTFTSYGGGGNHPVNDFAQYGDGGSDEFKAYDDRSNVGESGFQSYAKHGGDDGGAAAKARFDNYGNSFNPGSDRFKGYGEGSTAAAADIGFKNYHNENTTFKDYAKTGITFAAYRNSSSSSMAVAASSKWVEPGKFFRESSLKEGSAMTMADIRDRSPRRSFLPRPVADKLPFSAAELGRILRLPPDSALVRAMSDTVAECGRPPSPGETKRCATSAEDVVDFAVSVLGADVSVRSTESVNGWGRDVVLGGVRGVDGGRATKSVSCHQSLFPYLVYYCHSVPAVRVYEADILDAAGGGRINRGVAICHLDTSGWSPTHGAFAALGSRPGEIEVCHWIFEGDMTWTVAD